jgi:hypothetical protein
VSLVASLLLPFRIRGVRAWPSFDKLVSGHAYAIVKNAAKEEKN